MQEPLKMTKKGSSYCVSFDRSLENETGLLSYRTDQLKLKEMFYNVCMTKR